MRRTHHFSPSRGLLAAAALALASMSGLTDTLVVAPDGSTPWQTIQSALDAAQPGDTVLVRCGTYPETLVVQQSVTLRGESVPQACVVVDAGGKGSALTIDTVTREEAPRIEGLVLRGGATITGGAGINVRSGAPVITRNVIAGNGELDESNPLGVLTSFVGGILADAGTAPVITHNVIRGNGGFYGGGIVSLSADVRLESNLIVGNAGYIGGGMYFGFGTHRLLGNTIVSNYGAYAGGIWVYHADLDLTANVVAFNDIAGFGSAGGIYSVGPSDLSFTDNVFFENTLGSFPDPLEVAGNVSVDPRFTGMDPRSRVSFQPRSDSPLVDAAPAGGPDTDLRGIPVPVDGNADGHLAADRGARENEGLTGLVFDGTRWTWDRIPSESATYNVYRGLLDELESGGAYTQLPGSAEGAARFCGIPAPFADPDVPPSGATWFYLVTATDIVEGPLGFDSRPVERPNVAPCPGNPSVRSRDVR